MNILEITLVFLVKTWNLHYPKNERKEICRGEHTVRFSRDAIRGPSGSGSAWLPLYYIADEVHMHVESELGLFIFITYYRSKRSFHSWKFQRVDYYTAWSNSTKFVEKRDLPNHGQTCGHSFADVIWRIPNPTFNDIYKHVHDARVMPAVAVLHTWASPPRLQTVLAQKQALNLNSGPKCTQNGASCRQTNNVL